MSLERNSAAVQEPVASDLGIWLGQVDAEGKVRGVRLPLDQAFRTHWGLAMYADKRWRYREDSDGVLFWWGFSDLTANDKVAVERWLAARGIKAQEHVNNVQRVIVDEVEMYGFAWSHGSGPRAGWKMRVDAIRSENEGQHAFH
jgi:hypothetical protein